MFHQVDERQIIQRRQEADVRHAVQQSVDRFLHVWVQVDGVDDFHIAARCQLFEGGANIFKWLSKILASMSSHEDQLPIPNSQFTK